MHRSRLTSFIKLVEDRSSASWSLWIAAIAIILRVVVVLSKDPAVFAMGDTQDYLSAARALMDGQAYPESDGLPYWRPPGYPVILSVLWAVFGDSERVVLVAQSLCDGITSLVVFHLFRSRFDTAVGLLAQTWFAVYPPFIAYATTLQTETWFQLCVVSGFALVLSTRNPRAGRVFAAGLLLGVAALIRPIGLLVLPVLIAGVLTTKDRVRVPTLLRVVMLTSAGVFMPILPWSTSNVARTGGFSLITPASWFSIWLTTTEGAHRAMWDPHSAGPVLTRLYGEEIPALSENVRALTPRERQAFWRSKAMASFRENPGTALRYRARALIHTWKFWLTPGFYSTRAVFASILVFGPVVLLGFVGIARLAATRADPTLLIVCAGLFAVATIANLIGPPVLRYRIPIADPFLIGLASSWILSTVRSLART